MLPMVCDILIPAYNHPHLLRDLLKSLEKNTNRALLGRIWIGDDASDAFSREAVTTLIAASSLQVTCVHHDQNRGFGGNCTDLFQKSTATHCILLNTDTLVPHLWLERMLAPFEKDPRIALATPLSTNAAEHTITLRPGQSWIDADAERASRPARYPDSCTAIGFCLAVDRKKIIDAGMPLFDPQYGRGYGEDTDLHFRVLQKGWRSVLVDNLLIHHIGGASFLSVPDAEELRTKAYALFMERWQHHYKRLHTRWRRFDLWRKLQSTLNRLQPSRPAPQPLDILFVLPTTNPRYGGIWFANTLIASLIASGKRVGVFVEEEHQREWTKPFGFEPWTRPKDVWAFVSSIGCVVGTADSTLPMMKTIAAHFQCPDVVLLQGMEASFRSGQNVRTFRTYQTLSRALCVSEALADYIRLLNPKAAVTHLPSGPDPLVFYPRPVARVPRTVAIALNRTPEKGSSQALEIALLLKERGFTLTFFGWDHAFFNIPAELGTIINKTDRDTLAHLFSRTEFLIDHSFSEGLGLLPLEAAFCGCIPIIAPHGGPEYIFTGSVDSMVLRGYKHLREDIDHIDHLSDMDKQKMRANLSRIRERHSLPEALQQVSDSLSIIANSGQSPSPMQPAVSTRPSE